jgi:putative ABC transport system permease protein
MRFLTLLLDLFTAMAVLLAIGGIYGFVSYQVAQRTHEMGIRIALGATSGSLVMLIFRHTLKLVILGAALGVGLTVNAAFISRRLIYGISPLNPLHLAGGVLLIVLVALLGSGVPAIRGSRVDPVQALRTE